MDREAVKIVGRVGQEEEGWKKDNGKEILTWLCPLGGNGRRQWSLDRRGKVVWVKKLKKQGRQGGQKRDRLNITLTQNNWTSSVFCFY